MAFSEFTLEQVGRDLGISIAEADLFPGLVGQTPPEWLALGPAVPPLRAPIATVVEAKKNDVEAGLGQCIAQTAAARRFNASAGRTNAPIFGCMTTGETWQFLRLVDSVAVLDRTRFYLDNLAGILAMVREAESAQSQRA